MSPILLGVNIDHIATLRQVRGTVYPDPVQAAAVAEHAGADGITIHLREDRRHIIDRDVYILSQTLKTRMNLELAVTDEMIEIACKIKPAYVCFVPEKREELTTEGGLDVCAQIDKIKTAIEKLTAVGTKVSLFIDSQTKQIDAAIKVKASLIELHTGAYADATDFEKEKELVRIQKAATYASNAGLIVNAGHGLNYHNVKPIAAISEIYELNIGHAIIARASIDGLTNAVKDMKKLIQDARLGI